MSAAYEKVVRVREGDFLPPGYEVARILAMEYEFIGPGANYVRVYTVAARQPDDTPVADGKIQSFDHPAVAS